MTSSPKRPWYQFSLRSLLLLITILCLGPGGYIAYERDKAAKDTAAAEAIEKMGGVVEPNRSSRSALLRRILGDDRYSNIQTIGLENFRDDIHVSDVDLIHLRRFRNVKNLYLYNVDVTDAGSPELAALTELDSLILSRVKITDTSLVHLSGMSKLNSLNLDHTQIKGPGLKHLAGLKNLSFLTLRGTEIEPEEIERLQKVLPKLEISR
jgi:hypothetical protein